jgi:hypothetical protein
MKGDASRFAFGPRRAGAELLLALEHALGGRFANLLLVAAGLLLGWWISVPVHEFMHALACAATGGRVERLEIAATYGGHVWAMIFPWVSGGSDYGGRLSGFDTGGSDLVYLATDLGPFLLTIFPGLWALRRAARRRRVFLLGLLLPWPLAPFTSLTGDAYEIGSILVTNLPPWSDGATRDLLRGDDLFVQIERLGRAPGPAPWGGLALSGFAGLAWAVATYGAAHLAATALGQPPLRAIRGPAGAGAEAQRATGPGA